MRNIKLLIEFDGTNYSGWQKQNNAKTVQGIIEKAIGNLTGENIDLVGCSRTDSGVHAKGYVANFITNSSIPSNKFKFAINSKLPEDIVILDSKEVNLQFHSRYNSIGKCYCYSIYNGELPKVIGRNYIYHYSKKLDMNSMAKAGKYFLGKHDFNAFRAVGSSVKTTIRTITRLDIVKEDNFIKFYIAADGFLYNMVRIIVGTLLEVGTGKISSEEIPKIILSKNRKNAGKTVSGKGLCLEEVFY